LCDTAHTKAINKGTLILQKDTRLYEYAQSVSRFPYCSRSNLCWANPVPQDPYRAAISISAAAALIVELRPGTNPHQTGQSPRCPGAESQDPVEE
jgi:hypothetical protein